MFDHQAAVLDHHDAGLLEPGAARRVADAQLKRGICDACFSDDYPVPVDAEQPAPQLTLFRDIADDE